MSYFSQRKKFEVPRAIKAAASTTPSQAASPTQVSISAIRTMGPFGVNCLSDVGFLSCSLATRLSFPAVGHSLQVVCNGCPAEICELFPDGDCGRQLCPSYCPGTAGRSRRACGRPLQAPQLPGALHHQLHLHARQGGALLNLACSLLYLGAK